MNITQEIRKQQQMAKEKKGSQDDCKENKQHPEAQSRKCAQREEE